MKIKAGKKILRKTVGHELRLIRPRLWQLVFHLPAPTNCWLWQEDDGLTLIDAGQPWNAKAILASIELLAEPLKRIVITHAHPDHAGAAAALSEATAAPVYVHEEDLPFLDGTASMADLPGFWLCRAILGIGKHINILHPPAVANIKTIAEGETIGSLEVMHTPGHTPGSISLWSDSEKAIFCGDNVFTILNGVQMGLPWFTLDLPRRNLCVERYAKLGPDILLSGHGPAYDRECLTDDLLRLSASLK